MTVLTATACIIRGAMRPELEEALFSLEPLWFDRQRGPMTFGFEHDDGWHLIVKSLLELAIARRTAWAGVLADNPFAPGRFEVRQVRRKGGGLRFSHVGGDAVFLDAVREAEAESLVTCERCGAPGSGRDWRGDRTRTLCDTHAARPRP